MIAGTRMFPCAGSRHSLSAVEISLVTSIASLSNVHHALRSPDSARPTHHLERRVGRPFRLDRRSVALQAQGLAPGLGVEAVIRKVHGKAAEQQPLRANPDHRLHAEAW